MMEAIGEDDEEFNEVLEEEKPFQTGWYRGVCEAFAEMTRESGVKAGQLLRLRPYPVGAAEAGGRILAPPEPEPAKRRAQTEEVLK